MGHNMLSVPLPLLTACLCLAVAVAVARLDLGRAVARVFFAALFVVFATEALLVGLRFGYGVERFIVLQRMLPLYVGPLMYLGFITLALSDARLRRQAVVHLGLATLANGVFAMMVGRAAGFDGAIALSYLFYIGLLLQLWRGGPDRLIHARLDVAHHVTRWMLAAALLLVVILGFDSAIALSFALSQGTQAEALISYGSVVVIAVLVVILASLPSVMAASAKGPAQPTPDADQETREITATAHDLLEKSRLFLDPDLSVQRLARRMQLPERKLSAAINQSEGMNVSQYVNGFRLAHAARLLRESDDSVAKIMAQSGFLTRSNFYREFQRLYGQSPARYRAQDSGD